jgi:hypothetical protein
MRTSTTEKLTSFIVKDKHGEEYEILAVTKERSGTYYWYRSPKGIWHALHEQEIATETSDAA